MKRRQAATALALLAAGPNAALRAQPSRPICLGVLGTLSPAVPAVAPLWSAFYAELAARGWTEGSTLRVEARYNDGQPQRDAALTADLMAALPDVVLATNSGAVTALRNATSKMPIVMVNVSHAVESGYVASLARPGGNVTGVVNQAGDMQSKFVELLQAVKPDLARPAVLWSPANLGSALAFKDFDDVATRRGLRVLSMPIDNGAELEPALARAGLQGAQALQVHPTPAIGPSWRRIMAWAQEHKAVTLGQSTWVREGFLMSYWAHTPDLYRLAAGFVDRILRGAKPAEMPIEQPTRFELTINLRTARKIGATVPQSLLLRANEVVE